MAIKSSRLPDGHVLPHTFENAVQLGEYNKVPVILGVNANEGMFYVVRQLQDINTIAKYLWFVSTIFGKGALRLLEMFPVYADTDVSRVVADIITAGMFATPPRVVPNAYYLIG